MSVRAADDVVFIAKRLKELEEEKKARIAELPDELPSDVEPGMITLTEYWEFVRNGGLKWAKA